MSNLYNQAVFRSQLFIPLFTAESAYKFAFLFVYFLLLVKAWSHSRSHILWVTASNRECSTTITLFKIYLCKQDLMLKSDKKIIQILQLVLSISYPVSSNSNPSGSACWSKSLQLTMIQFFAVKSLPNSGIPCQ